MQKDDCMQEKCIHNKMNPNFMEGCPTCSKCGCEPQRINPSCNICIACENGEGYIRGGDKKEINVMEILIPIEVVEGMEVRMEQPKDKVDNNGKIPK